MIRATRLLCPRLLLALGALLTGPAAYSEVLSLPPLDFGKLATEDASKDALAGEPKRFAVAREVTATPAKSGEWTQQSDGTWLWELRIHAKDAAHLNFGFTRFNLPEGASLSIAQEEGSLSLGPYTRADRLPHGQLWTPVLPGDRAVVRLEVPAKLLHEVELELTRVNHGYRGFGERSKACKSGSCNMDVACLSESDPWNQNRRAVGAWTRGGVDACTGSLVNNTRNDRRMLFATATHCNANDDAAAASVVVYWNYESPTCRVPGSPASGAPAAAKPFTTSQGLRFLAGTNNPFTSANGAPGSRSDWALLELGPPSGGDVSLYWAGWDRRSTPANCAAPTDPASTTGLCASIHHPGVDEKRITFVESPTFVDNIQNAEGVHWRARWDPTPPRLPRISPMPGIIPPGVTEQGSSGSPLYNAQRRLVGVLSGGPAVCGATGDILSDLYGGLFHAWEGLGTPRTRMREHLDPLGGNPEFIDGVTSCTAPIVNLQLMSAIVSASQDVRAQVSPSGGSGGPYRIDWDLDGDGQYERPNGPLSVTARFARAFEGLVNVRVTDSAGCSATAGRALEVRAPQITATAAAAPQQVCGNGNAGLDPGERWRVPVTLTNTGNAPLPAGAHALFANASSGGGSLFGPDSFGYRGTNSNVDPGICGYGFVDISDAAALSLTAATSSEPAADDGRSSIINLGGNGFRLYGQSYTQAIMSTNGYVSFSTADNGGDFDNSCDGQINREGAGPRLHALHDDLVVGPGGALRYRYFASCPRAPLGGADQSCHVFQWDAMQVWSASSPSGDASFQAIAYPGNGQVVYQYRRANTNAGAGATIGLINAGGTDQLLAACDAANSAPSQSAICVFDPENLPPLPRLTLETPTLPLPALAAGASATVELNLRVPEGVACGSRVGIDYLATAVAGQHSMQPATVWSAQLVSNCSELSSCPAPASRPLPRRGFFSDPSRGGNGLAVYAYGDTANPVVGAIWYTGDRSYQSDWYTLAGPLRGGLLESPLFRTRNSQPSGFAPVTTEIGRIWLASVDARTQLYAWDFSDGGRGAELLTSTANTLPYANPDHTNAWVQTGQSGWGLAVEGLQLANGPSEFFGVYLFDASGQSRWLTGTSGSTSSGSVELSSQRTHCPGCPFYPDYATLATPGGTLTRSYSSRIRAQMSTAITLPAPLSGTWNRTNVEIQAFGDNNP